MCKINWEERVFQMAKDFYASGEYSMEGAINEAFEFKEIYLMVAKQLGESVEEATKEEKPKMSKDERVDDDFIEMIYSLYPTKCPKRGASLGKSTKDKDRIRKLLKTFTKEQIEAVVRKEVEDKYGIAYMQNFSTFLNNFPDPSIIEEPKEAKTIKEDTKLIIGGVVYR